jgi:ParB-like chromosome segregation protein Spo0J
MAKRKRLSPPRIETPEGVAPETKAAFPSYPLGIAPTRRMPIAEVAGDAAGAAALDEMGRTLGAAREEGRLIQWVGLDEIDENYLVRDRLVSDEEEMQALIDSLRERGQQTAIEVADLGEEARPRWGLISGWRRLTALRRIAAEEGVTGRVLALPRAPRNASEAYRAMVEENEIRVGLSHYERARIVARAVDSSVYESDSEALRSLFGAATRSRRSKIGSFVRIVRTLDDALRFPTHIGERLGLALSRGLEEDPALAADLRARLSAEAPDSSESEIALLGAILETSAARDTSSAPSRPDQPPRREAVEIRPGLTCRETAKGLVLSGELLRRAEMRARILQILREDASL